LANEYFRRGEGKTWLFVSSHWHFSLPKRPLSPFTLTNSVTLKTKVNVPPKYQNNQKLVR